MQNRERLPDDALPGALRRVFVGVGFAAIKHSAHLVTPMYADLCQLEAGSAPDDGILVDNALTKGTSVPLSKTFDDALVFAADLHHNRRQSVTHRV
jgi:hypothetical protein